MHYQTVLDFWFTELSPEDWFTQSDKVDSAISERFSELHERARKNELSAWRESADGALAEIIVLDQFSRNLFRNTAAAFAQDSQALALAQNAVRRGYDQSVGEQERLFFYLPYMHSESAHIHETALQLFTALGNEEALKYEQIHKDIIDRFGRYPHRNEVLGRQSTDEEVSYLATTEEDFF